MNRLLRRAAADQDGAAAIEFALIFPVIFVLHVAAAEALEVYLAQRNVAHIAAAMADVMAQSRVVTQADVDDVLVASTAMIHPFPGGVELHQRVSSMSANSSGTIATDWSSRRNWDFAGAPSVPAGYLLANESAIVTDVVYDYKPTFGLFLPSTIRFTRHAYVRPRLTTKVEKIG